MWDDHPISQCVRSKRLVSNNGEQSTLVCLPFIANGVPIGALVIVCDPGVNIPAIREDVVPLLSKIGGYFLSTSGGNLTPTANHNSGNVTLEEITTRQMKILQLMADGLTNAEIAGQVLLSESTVRQETIRIYRSLGVGGRLEAVAKGRALGLISKVTPPRRS
jgi:DNA-binding CsgD family transcriptional regulator